MGKYIYRHRFQQLHRRVREFQQTRLLLLVDNDVQFSAHISYRIGVEEVDVSDRRKPASPQVIIAPGVVRGVETKQAVVIGRCNYYVIARSRDLVGTNDLCMISWWQEVIHHSARLV
jgi:hypothetical protein